MGLTFCFSFFFFSFFLNGFNEVRTQGRFRSLQSPFSTTFFRFLAWNIASCTADQHDFVIKCFWHIAGYARTQKKPYIYFGHCEQKDWPKNKQNKTNKKLLSFWPLLWDGFQTSITWNRLPCARWVQHELQKKITTESGYPTYGACCFQNSPNSDMDYRFFSVRTNFNASDCTGGCTDTVRQTIQKAD